MIDSYLICATPRTGSTLLCQYLSSSEVAGRPHSYFRSQDMASWAKGWRILRDNGNYEFSEYLIAARAAASTENGVIAIRVMWESLKEIVAEIAKLYPACARSDMALLEAAFGQVRFIYLARRDVVAQAISLYRAEKTGYWHTVEGQKPEQPPLFDFAAIDARVKILRQQDASWRSWFQTIGVEPMVVAYEELSADPVASVQKVLDFLGVELPPYRRLEAVNRRLADDLTISWIEQYTRQSQEYAGQS